MIYVDESLPIAEKINLRAQSLKSQLKVLMICLSHSWGGLEQVAAQDAADLGELGIDVRLLCLEDSPIHVRMKQAKGVAAIPLDVRPRDYFDMGLRSVIRGEILDGVNLIHTHQTSLLGSISPWLVSFPSVALVASRHIMSDHRKKTFYHRLIYQRVDALVAMSEMLRQNIIGTHAINPTRVKLIHLGLDFEKFNTNRVDGLKQRLEWGADEETLVIGLVGRIDPAKGQSVFLKAAAGLIKKIPIKLKFVLVGEQTLGGESNHLEELRAIVAQFRLEANVVFAGYQQNIPEIMSALDIFVMPSKQEAFGLVAIEAMAMACPVVISRGGSAREIVGEEEYGLLVRPNDAFDLQSQLRVLIENPELRRQMGEKAKAFVHSRYDKFNRVLGTLALYDRCLKRRAQ